MSAPIASAYRLPADLAISDRSRKFYDGTYKWNAQGFTDEHGVYREFDFLDPLARAPTPMPPMFSDDEEDGDGVDVVSELAQPLNDNSVALSDEATVEPGTPYPKVSGSASSPVNVRSPGSIRRFAINFLRKKTDGEEYAPQNDSTKPIEDVVPAPEQAGELRRDHELERTPRAKDEKSVFNMPETPPKSPVNIAPGVKTTSPTPTTSTLSSAPSTLSEESKIVRIKIKNTSLIPQEALNAPPKATARSKVTTTTRGVAQKVTKSTKDRKWASSKSSPLKRKEKSVEELTLLELHSGAFMRNGLRRSARHSKSDGN